MDIKKCNCGHSVEGPIHKSYNENNMDLYYYIIRCTGCGIQIINDSYEEIIKRWNKVMGACNKCFS